MTSRTATTLRAASRSTMTTLWPAGCLEYCSRVPEPMETPRVGLP
ncbi:MAG: hypothetical protein ABIX00_11095 [Polaromonas sp.]